MSKWKLGTGMRRKDMMFLELVKEKKPQGKKGGKQTQDEEKKYRKVWYPVWVNPTSKQELVDKNIIPDRPTEGRLNFDWSEYTTDKERLKATKKTTANMTITEAFARVYNLDLHIDTTMECKVNHVPTDVKVGDILEVTITNISKNNVEFDCSNLKQTIRSKVNLYKFANFKRFIPKGTIRVKVVKANPEQIVVDPLIPMMDSWVNPIIANPAIQRVIGNAQTIEVKDLKLTKGGFLGKAVIPTISDWVGEDYTVDAFIPGSQIVLNIEENFEHWVGKTVKAFVTNYIPKPNPYKIPALEGQMSLICSVKEYLKFQGDELLLGMFNQWCDNGDEWAAITSIKFDGIVTGVICSSKKCGVFVEIPELHITGFVNTPADELTSYKPHTPVHVAIVDMEENLQYDNDTKQMYHEEPFVIKNGIMEKCHIKPVLKFI